MKLACFGLEQGKVFQGPVAQPTQFLVSISPLAGVDPDWFTLFRGNQSKVLISKLPLTQTSNMFCDLWTQSHALGFWDFPARKVLHSGSGRGVLVPHSRSFFTRILHPALFSSLS